MIYFVIDDVLFVIMFKIIRFRELTNEIWTDTNRVTDTSSSTLYQYLNEKRYEINKLENETITRES